MSHHIVVEGTTTTTTTSTTMMKKQNKNCHHLMRCRSVICNTQTPHSDMMISQCQKLY